MYFFIELTKFTQLAWESDMVYRPLIHTTLEISVPLYPGICARACVTSSVTCNFCVFDDTAGECHLGDFFKEVDPNGVNPSYDQSVMVLKGEKI